MKSQIIFGIDVSSKSSTVCVVIDRIKQGESFKITNDAFGYQKLYDRSNDYLITPLVVFEATGVYSLNLQAFLEDYHIKYLKLNPLKAKKLMDNNLRHNKTDKVDAYRLALIQFIAPQNYAIRSLENIMSYRMLVAIMKNLLRGWLPLKINCIVTFNLLFLKLNIYYLLHLAEFIGPLSVWFHMLNMFWIKMKHK